MSTTVSESTLSEPTPVRILEAAERCMQRHGLRRVSMADVASEAGVSRGSVYRHYGDRDRLVDAVLARTAERFVADAAAAIDRRRSLAAQVGEAAAFIVAHVGDDRYAVTVPGADDTVFATLLSVRIDHLLERWVEFWVPRLDAAVERREVRAGLDRRQASEWIVRLLLSFAVMPSVVVDTDDPTAVRRFVAAHLVQGLAR